MNTLRIISDKSRYVVAALLVAFSVFVPVMANAAQLEERSIELSSSTKTAQGVSYNIEFTAKASAGAVVVDFCSNSPLIGQACAAPGGLSLTSATVGGSTFTKDANSTASKLIVTGSVSAGSVSIPVSGVVNPNNAGTIYARIITFSNGTAAGAYDSTTAYDEDDNPNNPGTHVDDGSAAISITDSIAVSGDVLESLSFCVAGEAIPDECDLTGLKAPTLKLGDDMGNGVVALQPNNVSEGNVFTQISTNAVGGAVVRLKSNATGCGGLLRAGPGTAAERCGIAPAQLTDVLDADSDAKFGVKAVTGTDGGDAEGAFQTATNYNGSNFRMRYVDATDGVTSVYGDEFLNTNSQPALYKNMQLTFGAKAANNTPAGSYSADISLIATGKF